MNAAQKPIIAPSILSADFGYLAEAVKTIEAGRGDWVHLDIMDGSFVPNITFGPQMVASLRKQTGLPFDVHLMINHPENFIEKFAGAGADIITIHYESTVHVHRVLTEITRLGKKAGISIVPSTSAALISDIFPFVDLVLIMTVNPGFGGQSLIECTLDKLKYLKQIKQEKGYTFLIEADGGINRDTAKMVLDAGAEVLVVGSAVFKAKNMAEEIRALRG